jgi:2-polyprenyl-3-methyl-5-hydroxy-6-metoxy-1,4-benzoquinol methylase
VRFRTPKETARRAEDLYAKEKVLSGKHYDMPDPKDLPKYTSTKFASIEKNFDNYIEVLNKYLNPAAKILDFGASWGYGSYQMSAVGFDVYSYEIGELRAAYAKQHLGCNIVENLSELYGKMDCVFSSHVIEHLPNPNMIFEEAIKLLKPGGWFVCYCPNGNPERKDPTYHKVWGKIHPLFITPAYMSWAADRHGLQMIEQRAGRNLLGHELLTIAKM